MTASSARASSTRIFIAVGALLALAAALYWPSVGTLLARWSDPVETTYSHGYLIVAVSVWLLWRDRSHYAPAGGPFLPRAWQALLLLALCALWVLSYRAAIGALGMLLLPAIFWAAVLVAFGVPVARRTAFPLLYLYFAIPVWTAVNPLAQWATVLVVQTMLQVVGIPAYFQGNYVQIPEGTFVISDTCSGLHFLVVALAMGALLGELDKATWRVRLKLLLLSILLAVLTNWIRVFFVILAGHLSHMQHYLVRVDHRFFGWILFALGLPIYFLVARRIQARSAQSHMGVNARGSPPEPAGSAMTSVPAIGIALLILAVPMVWNLVIRPAPQTDVAALIRLPAEPDGWQRGEPDATGWQPTFKNADAVVSARYSRQDLGIEAFLAVYGEQRQGKELGGLGNDPAGGARVLARRSVDAPVALSELRIRMSSGEEKLIWYGFQVGTEWRRSPGLAQLVYSAKAVGSLRSPVSRVLVIAAPCDSGCDVARSSLAEFSTGPGASLFSRSEQ